MDKGEGMVEFGLVVLAFLFAILAIRAKRLLLSAIWLAGASAILSVLFFMAGADYLAVFELSIGAGLVTVLFVFAISISGEEELGGRSIIPKPFAIGLCLLSVILLGWLIFPIEALKPIRVKSELTVTLWHQRPLDIVIQAVQIFSGVLGLLGLLAETKAPLEYPVAEEVSLRREQDLKAMTPPDMQEEKR